MSIQVSKSQIIWSSNDRKAHLATSSPSVFMQGLGGKMELHIQRQCDTE